MSKTIYVINGPNLNLLGNREINIYGDKTLDDIRVECEGHAKQLGYEISFHQSNFEGGIVEIIHEAHEKGCGIALNAGAYTHTSISILDALKAGNTPAIELHLSNIYNREEFRHKSYISKTANGIIAGFGVYSYLLAINALDYILKDK